MVTVRIPTALRAYAGGNAKVTVDAATVDEAMESLAGEFGELRTHLFDDDGAVRSYVNLYLNSEDVRDLKGGATPVAEDDTLVVVPAVAGGAAAGGATAA